MAQEGREPQPALQKETSGSGGTVGISARYFCTAGRGMEPFLMKEVQARLGATQVKGSAVVLRGRGRLRLTVSSGPYALSADFM